MMTSRPSPADSPSDAASGHSSDDGLRDRVEGVLNLMRPAIQSDGGDLELVNVTSAGVVSVRFHGACVGCPSSSLTLQSGIERRLKERVPEVTSVVSVA